MHPQPQATLAARSDLRFQRRGKRPRQSQRHKVFDIILRLGPNPSNSDVQEALQSLCEWQSEPRQVTRLLQDARSSVIDVILRGMQRNHVETNVWHLNAAAGSFVDGSSWQKAVRLIGAMHRSIIFPDVTTAAVSTRAFMEGGRWRCSLEHLGHMRDMRADIRSYTKSFLAPCTARSRWQLSFWFLRISISLELQPDAISFAEVLSVCKRGARLWARALLGTKGLHVTESARTANSYLGVLSGLSRWRDVVSLLTRMGSMRLSWDQISANTVINAVPLWQASLSYFNSFGAHALEPDIVSHGSAIPLAAGTWQEGLNFLSAMQLRQASPNSLIWNSFMDTLATEVRWLQAFELVHQLPCRSVQRDVITYAACMLATQSALLWQKSFTLASSMSHKALGHDAMSCCIFSRASESWQRAYTMLHAISCHVRMDVITQNSLLAVCSKASSWACALELSASMQATGISQDRASFGALISACTPRMQSPHSPWEPALHLLDKAQPLQLDTASCNSAISACTQSECWGGSLALLHSMPSRGVLADEVSFSVGMQACKGERWMRTILLFEELLCRRLGQELCRLLVLPECEQHALRSFEAAIVDGLCVQVGDFGDAFSGMTGEAAETELVCKAAKITPETIRSLSASTWFDH
ncbi:Pentatricopeptide repeat-containing protein, chloroplastic [Symbiodinium microadriaticum]|uniref:Pentatricopeptide repeat-containing protein, chloroplastic n=1 Tax=Symbiodinium microadriaticum TaxID=2951 RepID=A0A1Q9DF11_SYMMI|nr:Pentatricopeptide repeat-containing protein, chloroplastic [Symbiodinium microadriaticum]CAE7732120.1 unnamed protein product [Symbiodinium microadriaticum]